MIRQCPGVAAIVIAEWSNPASQAMEARATITAGRCRFVGIVASVLLCLAGNCVQCRGYGMLMSSWSKYKESYDQQ